MSADAPGPAGASPGPAPDRFRWQALFQRCGEPLFVLGRRRQLLFVNRAWEALAGVTAGEARGKICHRQAGPAALHNSPLDVIRRALAPPPEVRRGHSARVRRLLPGRAARWWDVEFTPLRSGGELLAVLGRIVVAPADDPPPPVPLPERLANLRQRAAQRSTLDQLPTELPALRRLADQARLAADLTVPALLLGEPGSGKQTLARTIHHLGPTREQPFVALDCARLPAAALAHVLFPEAGAREAATVYLKEPAQLPRELQLRLCALLAAPGEGARLRLLAGCGADPIDQVKSGRMLEGFYHGLATLVLPVPPLRQRRADLPGLVERMLARLNERGGTAVKGLTADAWELVNAYLWPGNLRELFAALASARQRVAGDQISAAELPAPIRLSVRLEQTPGRAPERPMPLDQLLEDIERWLITRALRRFEGNKTRAAEYLAIWKPRLLRRMAKLGLAEADEAPDDEAEE